MLGIYPLSIYPTSSGDWADMLFAQQFHFSLMTPVKRLEILCRQSWMWLIPYPVRVFDFVDMILQNCLRQSSIQLASLSFSLDEAKKAPISDSEKKYAVFKVDTNFVTLTCNYQV